MVITAKCAHCGAQIVFSQNTEAVLCKYCDSVNVVPRTIKPAVSVPSSAEASVNEVETQEIELIELVPQRVITPVTYWILEDEWIFGDLLITENELCFKPRKDLNDKLTGKQKFKGMTEECFETVRYVPLEKIDQYKPTSTGLMLHLHTTNGVQIKMQIISRSGVKSGEIEREIIERQKKLFLNTVMQEINKFDEFNESHFTPTDDLNQNVSDNLEKKTFKNEEYSTEYQSQKDSRKKTFNLIKYIVLTILILLYIMAKCS